MEDHVGPAEISDLCALTFGRAREIEGADGQESCMGFLPRHHALYAPQSSKKQFLPEHDVFH